MAERHPDLKFEVDKFKDRSIQDQREELQQDDHDIALNIEVEFDQDPQTIAQGEEVEVEFTEALPADFVDDTEELNKKDYKETDLVVDITK